MTVFDPSPALRQTWPRPSRPEPVVIIGAGGIVRDAHLPTYQRLGIPIQGLFDVDVERAHKLASVFQIERVYTTLNEAAASGAACFDVAVPASAITSVLVPLPRGSSVLIQKPLGVDLDDARRIAVLCRERELTAAVNFQLRFSPNMLALKDLLVRGALGTLSDVLLRIHTHTPWHLWPFLKGIRRHEILYHSVHYLDLLRHLLGEPRAVYAKVTGHPALSGYSDTATSIILDHGDELRVSLNMNHGHDFGDRHAQSTLSIEGTEGAVVTSMGVNLDYPRGKPDTFEICPKGGAWQGIWLRGSWFTEAFEGPICNLQRYVAGEDEELVSGVADALKTMAVVEACYQSSQAGGTPIPSESK